MHKGLLLKYEGPFEVVRKSSELKLPRKLRIHPIFHASILKPYHEAQKILHERCLRELLH